MPNIIYIYVFSITHNVEKFLINRVVESLKSNLFNKNYDFFYGYYCFKYAIKYILIFENNWIVKKKEKNKKKIKNTLNEINFAINKYQGFRLNDKKVLKLHTLLEYLYDPWTLFI